MDERVKKLRTPKECENFGVNAAEKEPAGLGKRGANPSGPTRATQYGARSQAETEALEAVYAYEEVLSKKNGRRTRASRTWQMIQRHGIIGAERAVEGGQETQGYTALIENGAGGVRLRGGDSTPSIVIQCHSR